MNRIIRKTGKKTKTQHPSFTDPSQSLLRYSCVCASLRVSVFARQYLTLFSALPPSLPLSLQLRWACGASDPLSPTLFLRLSLLRRSHSWLWMDCAYLHSSRRLWTLQVCAADRAPVFARLSRLCARVCLRDYLGFGAIFSSTLQMKMWRGEM